MTTKINKPANKKPIRKLMVKITTKRLAKKTPLAKKTTKAVSKKSKKTEVKATRKKAVPTPAANLVESVREITGQSEGGVPSVGAIVTAKIIRAPQAEGLSVLVGCFRGLVRGSSLGRDLDKRREFVSSLKQGQEIRCVVRSCRGLLDNRRLTLDLVKGDQTEPHCVCWIDGANVLGLLQSDGAVMRSVLPRLCDYLEARSLNPLVVLKASTLHWVKITFPEIYPELNDFAHDRSRCVLIPRSSLDDDRFILDALKKDPSAIALSRDRFTEFRDEYGPEIMRRIRTYVPVIVHGAPAIRPYIVIDGLGNVEL